MNREILFRAKRVDNGEWVEGSLICLDDEHYYIIPQFEGASTMTIIQILNCTLVTVVPSTICQYTGLNDLNMERIWENDILKGYEYPFLSDNDFNYFAIVCWADEKKCFGLYTVKNPKSSVCGISEGNFELLEDFDSGQWEVIGNIFDSPELLGRT